MIEIGRLCVKTAGRDAGEKCVVLDIIDKNYVLIDGSTRRRKCNIKHILPLKEIVNIKKNDSHEDVVAAFKELGVEAWSTKPKAKTARPRRRRKTPEQLRVQREEKKKLRGVFRKKAEAVPKKEESLEAKAGIPESKNENEAKEKKEAKHKVKKSGKKE